MFSELWAHQSAPSLCFGTPSGIPVLWLFAEAEVGVPDYGVSKEWAVIFHFSKMQGWFWMWHWLCCSMYGPPPHSSWSHARCLWGCGGDRLAMWRCCQQVWAQLCVAVIVSIWIRISCGIIFFSLFVRTFLCQPLHEIKLKPANVSSCHFVGAVFVERWNINTVLFTFQVG